MKLKFDYEPVAKARAKTAFTNGIIRTYTPARTKKAEDAIKKDIKALIEAGKVMPFPARTSLKLVVTFYRCKSMWQPKYVDMPYIKPDLSNLIKLVEDSLQSIVPNDAQVTTIIAKKRWTKSSQALSRKKRRTGRNRGYTIVEIKEDN